MKERVTRIWWAVVLMLCLHPGQAYAHARLKRSEPAANARLAGAPRVLRFWFSESPEIALTTVALLDSAGRSLPLGVASRDAEGQNGVRVSVGLTLASGTYTVSWRTAAADGHPSSGSFTFRVDAPAAPDTAATHGTRQSVAPPGPASAQATAQRSATLPADSDSAALAPAYVAARAVSFIALLLVIGAVAFRARVVNRVITLDAPVRAGMGANAAGRAAIATLVLIAAAMVRLWLQNRMLAGSAAADAAHLRTMAMETSWGSAWRLHFGAAFAALLGFVLAARRHAAGWVIAALACIALAFATSLGGHAGAAENFRAFALLADTIHILAAATWLGTLAWLVIVGLGMRGTAIPLVRAFSPLALASAALVMLTGIASAWLRLGTLPNLWSSSYGEVLLVKLIVLAGVAGSGLYNWKRAKPALGAEGSAEQLRRSASTELGFAIGVVIVTAVLVAMPLPAM